MKDNRELRKYLLSRFLLTLILVGFLQMVLNLAVRALIIPEIENLLGLEGLFNSGSVSEAIRVFISCLLTIILRATIGSGSLIDSIFTNDIIVKAIGPDIRDILISINSHLDDTRLAIYAGLVVSFFLLLLVIWALPYVVGAVVYSKKVTSKVNELERARIEREQEYEKQRNLLLSDITHDIKTPITTIAGFSQALSDGTVPEDEKESYLKAINNKSMKVSELIALLFEYIKLDSSGYKLNKADIDFAELIRECVAGVYTEFEEKDMSVDLNIPESKVMINADKMQMERAINNILSNTIKHNSKGTPVKIDMKVDKREAVLEISDKGARIEKEDAIHLFEPFYLADKSRKSGSGNGLGLSITKKIVEMHGGKIILIQYKDVEKHGLVKTFRINLNRTF